MKRRTIFTITLLLTCLFIPHLSVSASSGALRKASIVTCGGVTYGQHSSNGVLHWHIAVKAGDGWNASGDPFYSNPCSNASGSSTQSSSSASSSSQGSTAYAAPTSPAVAAKSGDTSLATLSVNGQNIKIGETMVATITSDYATIKVTPTDSKAVAKIIDTLDDPIDEGATVQTTIRITAENGSTQDYKLNISRECSPISFEFYLNDERVHFDLNDTYTNNFEYDDSTLNFTYTASNSEEVKVYRNNAEIIPGASVDVGTNEYSIIVTNACQKTEQYNMTIIRSNRTDSPAAIVYGFLCLGLIGAGIYAYMYYGKKGKNKAKSSNKSGSKKKSSSKNGKTKK